MQIFWLRRVIWWLCCYLFSIYFSPFIQRTFFGALFQGGLGDLLLEGGLWFRLDWTCHWIQLKMADGHHVQILWFPWASVYGYLFQEDVCFEYELWGLIFWVGLFSGGGVGGAISRNIQYLMCGVLSSGLWVRLQRCERTLKNRWLVWNGIQMSRQGKILFYFNYKIVKVTLKSTKNKTVTNCDCVKNEIFTRLLFWVLAILGFARSYVVFRRFGIF